jgi:CRP/FNR family transcriptional regulator, cyclic AMP receptor protein
MPQRVKAERIRLIDAFPELVPELDDEQLRLASRYTLTSWLLAAGPWKPGDPPEPGPGHLGLLVVDGLLTREVVLGEALATELVGRGDLLWPAGHDGLQAPVPFDVEWQVVRPTQMAVLDRDFARVVGHWPELLELMVHGAVRRSHSLAVTLAVSHLRRVDARLLVMMWHLADRWGKVRPDGVHVPLQLTHQTLGRLVGAQRPSVTTALKQLAVEGKLTRAENHTWLLHGEPPTTLERPRDHNVA